MEDNAVINRIGVVDEDLSETQATEPPLTEEEYSILRRNMSGMGSSTLRRLIEPAPQSSKTEWSHQELFNQLTRADTLENNPGCVDPNLLSKSGDESSTEATHVVDSSSNPVSHPPLLTSTLSFPSTEQFPGDYGFHCAFEKLNSNHKNKFWEYSEKLNKLFIEINKNIQISFKLLSGKDYSDLHVRAMVVYAEEASVKEPVLRCPMHASMDHETNAHFPREHVQHIIRADHPSSLYTVERASGRHSVCVPISKPAVGTDYCSRIYKFMCLGSDPGGINRRPVKLIFTLEKASGETLGRDSLDLRICACPGRDMFKEEKRLRIKEERLQRLAGGMRETNSPSGGQPSSKKRKTELLQELVFIPVAKEDFDKLNEFAEAAMIVRHPDQRDLIRNERQRLIAEMNGS